MTDTPEAVAACSWCGGKARTHGLGCPQATRPDADIVRQLVEACERLLADLDSRPMSGLKTIGRVEKLRARVNAARAAGYGGQS